jgi:hypothetical protein
LRSPHISEHNACFTFQYSANLVNDGYYGKNRVFVFIRDANNGQLLPSWAKNVYDETGEWRTVTILLAHKSGFNQVNPLFVKILFEPNLCIVENLKANLHYTTFV